MTRFVLAVVTAVLVLARAGAHAEPLSWSDLSDLPWPSPQESYASYDQAREAMWNDVYSEGGVELYCRTAFSHAAVEEMELLGNRLSLEHAFPADTAAEFFGFETRDCDTAIAGVARSRRALCLSAVADLHNLWPAYERLNQSRGKVPFGELPGEGTRRPAWRVFCPDFERQRAPREGMVEPTIEARGDIARSLIYMHFVYGLPLDDVIAEQSLLLDWHAMDPPDARERARGVAIERVQPGTWNPLISGG